MSNPGANPILGQVPLVLSDGRELTLAMDFHALVGAERAYGEPMHKLMSDALAGFVSANAAILFGALQTHQPGITLREATGLFGSDGAAVEAALDAASAAAFPKAAEDKKAGNAP